MKYPAIETTLGKYELKREIGRGGMGCVFESLDVLKNEKVALKVLGNSLRDGAELEAMARFRREADLLAGFHHPNVVKFHGFGTDGNFMFIAMELIDGTTLKQVLQHRGQFQVKDFFEIAIQLAEMLSHAQELGLVHRDLKPQNIMLVPSQGSDVVKVLDFGLSVLTHELSRSRGVQVSNDHMMGTIAYAAPEQSGFMDRPVDTRADLYSLGVVLFEMLIGRPPFQGTDVGSIVYQHMSKDSPLVSDIRPEIPSIISEIIAKLLQKDVDARYQTAQGLLHDLKECRKNFHEGQSNVSFKLGNADYFRDLQVGSRLIGRERQFEALKKSLTLVQSGTPHAVVINGELGMGKSFLLSEFRPVTFVYRAMFLVCRLQRANFEYSLKPAFVLIEDCARRISRYTEAKRRSFIERVGAVLLQHEKIISHFCPSAIEIIEEAHEIFSDAQSGIDQNVDKTFSSEEQQQAICDFILCLAAYDNPLVLQFDDLHWADSEFISFVQTLLAKAARCHAKLLLLITVSSENLIGNQMCQDLIREWRKAAIYVNQMTLEHLSYEDVHKFISDIIKDGPDKIAACAKTVFASSSGNPLFVREVLKSLVTSNHLRFNLETKSWIFDEESLETLNIPKSVLELLIHKTRQFDSVTRTLLATGARIGVDFTVNALSEIHPEMDEYVYAALKKSQSASIITEKDGAYWFVHSQIREHFANGHGSQEGDENFRDIHSRIFQHLKAHPLEKDLDYVRKCAHHAWLGLRDSNPKVVFEECWNASKMCTSLADLAGACEHLEHAYQTGLKSVEIADVQLLNLVKAELAEALHQHGDSARALLLLNEVCEQLSTALPGITSEQFLDAYEKILRISYLRGDPVEVGAKFASSTEIAMSYLRTEIESKESNAIGNMFGKVSNLFYTPKIQIILKDDYSEKQKRIVMCIHFLFLSYTANVQPEDSEWSVRLLCKLWQKDRSLFSACQTELLWQVWYEDFTVQMTISPMQNLIEEILSEFQGAGMPYSPAAGVYLLSMELLREAPSLNQELFNHVIVRFENILEACETRNFWHPCLVAAQVKANVSFIRGDWDSVMNCGDQAMDFAAKLGWPVLHAECSANMAAFFALKDFAKYQYFLSESMLYQHSHCRIEALRCIAKALCHFAEHPYSNEVSSARLIDEMIPGQWKIYFPIAIFGIHVGYSSALANDPADMSLKMRIECLFGNCAEKSYLDLVKNGLLAMHGSNESNAECQDGVFLAESLCHALGFPTWTMVTRFNLHRLKLGRAKTLTSAALRDEALSHLEVAASMCHELCLTRLGDQFRKHAPQTVQSETHTTTLFSRASGRDVSAIFQKLKIDKVFALGSEILSKQDIDTLVSSALSGLIDLTGAQRGAVFVREKESQSFPLRALQGFGVTLADLGDSSSGETLSYERAVPLCWPVVGRVRDNMQTIVIDNAQVDDSMANQFLVVHQHLRSVLGIPLICNAQLVGIMYLDNCVAHQLFNKDVLRLIEPIISQVGISLGNIWLRQATEAAFLALKQSQSTLLQTEKLAGIGELAASAAHDLNTPLLTILGYAEEIQDIIAEGNGMPQDISEQIAEYSRKIIQAGGKMRKLVLSMRDFSRKSNNEFLPVAFRQIFEEVLLLTEKKLSALGVEIDVQIPENLPKLFANANQLEQVFMNLMNNAADAMENEVLKKLTIAAVVRSNGGVEIILSDTGPGIPQHIRDNIFQSFFTTKPEGKGTGLGLSIVKSIVESHHGSISVRSEVGQGAHFSLLLPAIAPNGSVVGELLSFKTPEKKVSLQNSELFENLASDFAPRKKAI